MRNNSNLLIHECKTHEPIHPRTKKGMSIWYARNLPRIFTVTPNNCYRPGVCRTSVSSDRSLFQWKICVNSFHSSKSLTNVKKENVWIVLILPSPHHGPCFQGLLFKFCSFSSQTTPESPRDASAHQSMLQPIPCPAHHTRIQCLRYPPSPWHSKFADSW